MKTKILALLLFLCTSLCFFILPGCGGGTSSDGNGDEVAKWGSAIWGQSTWEP
jgi:hypothetical protein